MTAALKLSFTKQLLKRLHVVWNPLSLLLQFNGENCFPFCGNLMLPWTGSHDFRGWLPNSHACMYGLPQWEIHFLLDFVSEITLWHHSFLLPLKGINETWHQKFICKVVFYYILCSENAFLDLCDKNVCWGYGGCYSQCGQEIKHIVSSPDWEVNIFREILTSILK